MEGLVSACAALLPHSSSARDGSLPDRMAMLSGGLRRSSLGETFLPQLTSGRDRVDVSPCSHSAEVLDVGTKNQEAGLG